MNARKEGKPKTVDPRLLQADEDLRELLRELGGRESTPMDSKRTPYEEEMDSMRSSGRGRIRGRSI